MNIKDLMIGDYVFHEKYGNAKVEMITNDFMGDPEVMLISENIKHKDGYEYGYCYSYPDEIYPIPLTQEILEKNGFYEQSEDYMRYFKSYDENYYFGFESISYCLDTKIAKVIKEGKQSGVQEKVELVCAYVHQLQHALKLCGIEKEIVL